MAKMFTLGEAQTLLPLLEALVQRAREAAGRGAELELASEALTRRIYLSGGMHVDVEAAARRRAEQDRAAQEANATVEEIEEIGVRLHNLGEGLLDFPCQVEDGVVLLCWRIGEESVEHWHMEGEENPLRRPLDWRFGRGERDLLH